MSLAFCLVAYSWLVIYAFCKLGLGLKLLKLDDLWYVKNKYINCKPRFAMIVADNETAVDLI